MSCIAEHILKANSALTRSACACCVLSTDLEGYRRYFSCMRVTSTLNWRDSGAVADHGRKHFANWPKGGGGVAAIVERQARWKRGEVDCKPHGTTDSHSDSCGERLQWLGTLYRTPADALKEHVSNAIDEHLKAQLNGTAVAHCQVRFHLDSKHITIEYPYGMSRPEFESALQRVADPRRKRARLAPSGGWASAFLVFSRSEGSAFSSAASRMLARP